MGAKNSPTLKVRFAPEWLSFLDAVWGNYWVVDIDPAYQLVAVGEPSREFLWVLSRTPTVPAPEYRALLRRLEAQGFDVSKLESTPQAASGPSANR
jgi:apolipoprotein D and lipocalin family protein